MSNYSITYIGTTETEETSPFGFSIPVQQDCTTKEIESEILEILREFFPEHWKNIPSSDLQYALFSAYPSWIGLEESEEMFLNFELSQC
jgi:hypothetical protein